jgi:hypothetical protein
MQNQQKRTVEIQESCLTMKNANYGISKVIIPNASRSVNDIPFVIVEERQQPACVLVLLPWMRTFEILRCKARLPEVLLRQGVVGADNGRAP